MIAGKTLGLRDCWDSVELTPIKSRSQLPLPRPSKLEPQNPRTDVVEVEQGSSHAATAVSWP